MNSSCENEIYFFSVLPRSAETVFVIACATLVCSEEIVYNAMAVLKCMALENKVELQKVALRGV